MLHNGWMIRILLFVSLDEICCFKDHHLLFFFFSFSFSIPLKFGKLYHNFPILVHICILCENLLLYEVLFRTILSKHVPTFFIQLAFLPFYCLFDQRHTETLTWARHKKALKMSIRCISVNERWIMEVRNVLFSLMMET